MDINILSTFYLFLNDYLNCALYPLFAITYCYNKNITIMIKNIIFCKNNENCEYIHPSLLFSDDTRMSLNPTDYSISL